MSRWLHLCWLLPLLLAVLALGALDYLAYTPAGLKVVQSALNRRIGPVLVQAYGATGTLAYGLHVNRVVIDHRRVHIEIEDANAQLAILPLLWRTIQVPQLHAKRVLVRVFPRVEDGNVWQPHFMPPLSRVDARFVAADHWRLVLPSGQEYDTDNVTVSAAVFPKRVRIYAARFDYEDAHLRTSGDVLAAPVDRGGRRGARGCSTRESTALDRQRPSERRHGAPGVGRYDQRTLCRRVCRVRSRR
jgi:hypothetical protein